VFHPDVFCCLIIYCYLLHICAILLQLVMQLFLSDTWFDLSDAPITAGTARTNIGGHDVGGAQGSRVLGILLQELAVAIDCPVVMQFV
jgi:hypothetical protein